MRRLPTGIIKGCHHQISPELSKDLYCGFNSNSLHFKRDPPPGTQMNLLKPSDRAERTIDTLVHYHKSTSALGRPRAAEFDGIAAELSWNYFFPMVVQSGTQVQPAAHVVRFTNLGSYTADSE